MKPNRLAELHRFLDEHAELVQGWDFGQIRFDWSPGDIKTFIGRSGKIGRTREEKLSA